jgi:hypothetical protein
VSEKINHRIEQVIKNLSFMIPEEYISLFEAYHEGELFGQTLSDFEARLSYDAEFKSAYNRFLELKNGIRRHFNRELLKRKLEMQDEIFDHKNNHRSTFRKRIVISIVSLAAGVALFFGVFLDKTNQNKGVSDYWPYEEGLPVQMGDSNVYNSAMNSFKMEQWEQSYAQFSRFKSDTAVYFASLCKYHLQNLKAASELLVKIPEKSVFFMDATIRIALIKLQQGEKSEAKRILELISADEKHKHYNLASRILIEI